MSQVTESRAVVHAFNPTFRTRSSTTRGGIASP